MENDPIEAVVLTLYTKDPCPLCDRLKAIMQPVIDAGGRPVRIEEVDITRDPGLLEQFRIRIPVVTVDDRVLFEGRPEQSEVEAALKPLVSE